jgi:uncharacterized repeat protein (TIGR01451 family)
MFKGKEFFGIAALIVCSAGSQAFAQEQGCIQLKSVAETETEIVNAAGVKSLQRVPANKIVPGTVVIYTITASNVCKKASDVVVISNPVPEHMSYVANSATGANTDISYSIDGKTFGSPDQLTVTENGAKRKARSDEYRLVRWSLRGPLAPAASVAGSFRAVLN